MTDIDWDAALRELNTESDIAYFKADQIIEKCVELAVDWMIEIDFLGGGELTEELGINHPSFHDASLAMATGIQIALAGIHHPGGEELNQRLQRLKYAVDAVTESFREDDDDRI